MRLAIFSLKMPISIRRTVLDLEGARMRFSPFACARCARSFLLLHILHQTPQTELHTENQMARYHGSGLKVCVGGGGGGWCKPNLVFSIDLGSS